MTRERKGGETSSSAEREHAKKLRAWYEDIRKHYPEIFPDSPIFEASRVKEHFQTLSDEQLKMLAYLQRERFYRTHPDREQAFTGSEGFSFADALRYKPLFDGEV